MHNFCIPSDFNLDTIEKLFVLNESSENYRVYETYGEMSNTQFSSGRINVPYTDISSLEKYIINSHNHGIKFDYLMNGLSFNNMELTLNGIKSIRSFIKQLDKISVDSITVSLPALVDIIQEEDTKIAVNISTINQVSDVETARIYDNKNISRIVLSETINRNFSQIELIKKNVSCELEVIVNSVCFIKCPWRIYHYNQIAQSRYDHLRDLATNCYYTNKCFMRRLEDTANYLKLAFIRPEDLHHYSTLGVKYFKVQGRQFIEKANIVKTLQAYFSRDYSGNIMSLLNCFASKSNEVYIDNKELNGFITPFLGSDICAKGCKGCNHCREFINKSCRTNLAKLDIIKEFISQNDPYINLLKESE